MIPSANITAMWISAVIAVFFPLILMIWFYRKRRISFVPIGIGAVMFLVFAMGLEQVMHYFVFKNIPGIKDNTALYVLYGSLAAGTFEECGRFVAFKFILKKRREWKDGIAYGIGHGGIEAWLVGGLGLIGMIITAMMLNNGTFPFSSAPVESQEKIHAIQKQLSEASWPTFLLAGAERIMAICAHIGFSTIVLYGVRNNRSIYLLYAILLHALMDVGAALYQKGVLNVWVVETIVACFAVAAVILVSRSEKYFTPLVEREKPYEESDAIDASLE